MSGEIRINYNLALKTGWLIDNVSKSLVIDQATPLRGGTSQIIASDVSEVIDIGEVDTGGWIVMVNTDDWFSIDWGVDDTGSMTKCGTILPGEFASFRTAATTVLRAQTVSGSSGLQYAVLDVHIYAE